MNKSKGLLEDDILFWRIRYKGLRSDHCLVLLIQLPRP